MPTYDGVVTLEESDVPVIVELADDFVRLSASGTEIGHWSTEECHIDHVGDTLYAIHAENETLQFVPNEPSLFAAAVHGSNGSATRQPLPEEIEEPVWKAPTAEAPPPKPLTLVCFYALCAATAGLAVWSLISLFS